MYLTEWIFEVWKDTEGYTFQERCDNYFRTTLTRDEVRQLVRELEMMLVETDRS